MWRVALCLCMLLMVSRGLSLDSETRAHEAGHEAHGATESPHSGTGTGTEGHDVTGDSGHGDSGHGDGGHGDSGHDDGGHGDGGHGAGPITTLPIVTWKWHHVTQPYLVTLWILVCWICKLCESHQSQTDLFIKKLFQFSWL